MASLKTVFLSANIPTVHDKKYYSTADVINIREAIRAFIKEVLPRGLLMFEEGQPAISSFIKRTADLLGKSENLRIFQSENLLEMLDEENIVAGVFIGGMEDVEEEFNLFRQRHPSKPCYPIPTTGGAAAVLYPRLSFPPELDAELAQAVGYDFLFKRLLRPLFVVKQQKKEADE